MKKDPSKYEKQMETDRLYSASYRLNLREEQKKKSNEY